MKGFLEKVESMSILHFFSWLFFFVFVGGAFAASNSPAQSAPTQMQSAPAQMQPAPTQMPSARPQAGIDARINRYVISISANNGGENRPMLRYAESDAKSFANVLKEMGGVQPQNVMLVKQPSVAGLKQEFAKLDSRLSQVKVNGGRNEVLVYYSGHADDRGLRLGDETYAWKEFRSRIDSLNVDVKIAVIDACGSGAITRVKGGVAVPAFMVDESSDMKGYAFITSSTQDEASQESDRLKGSFFTHSLVSGLRGAGDISGDGRVTLSEAYQFAFNETLQKTEATMGGAQHPSRDMNLAGTGDVVMTDLNSNAALLELANDVDGRLFIRSGSGELVAELNKKGGHPMSLGLPAGKYSVRLETAMNANSSTVKETNVALVNGKRENLALANFKDSKVEKTVLRGEIGTSRSCAAGDSVECSLDSLDHNGTFRTTFNFFDYDKDPRKGLQIGLFSTKTDDYMLGSQISLFANIAKKEMHGLQASLITNFALERFNGIQFNTFLNYAGAVDGAQASYMLNIVKDRIDGAQISAGLNYAGSFSGAQAAFGLNIAVGNSAGAQVGIFNVAADSLNGAQVSPLNIAEQATIQVGLMNFAKYSDIQVSLMNFAREENSSQVGLINYSRNAKGRQWGLINIAPHAEKNPIGLLNIVGNGLWSLSANIDEMGNTALNFKMGTALMYAAIEMGRVLKQDDVFEYEDLYLDGLGIGTQFGQYGSHWGAEYMFIRQDEHIHARFGPGYAGPFIEQHRLRLYRTAKIITGLGITAGLSMNVLAHADFSEKCSVPKFMQKPRGEWHADLKKGHETEFRVWPGFFAGFTVGRF